VTSGAKDKLDDRFIQEMTETVRGMHTSGIMSDDDYKMTMHDLNRAPPADTVVPLTGDEIKELRERAHMSQAVFARYLHVTPAHVSKLERGAKRLTGPALVLLNVIRRKGIETIL
jgi:putative transcriptional regulator